MSRTATLDAIAHDEATHHAGNMDRGGLGASFPTSPAPLLPAVPPDRLPVLKLNLVDQP